MTMRRPLIAGNWKMNGLEAEARALIRSLNALLVSGEGPDCDILVCPPATALSAVRDELGEGIALGGQDCHAQPKGAHTGDVSAEMLADAGCRFVIVGHSERRADHDETDKLVRSKAEAAYRAGIGAVVCVGETEAQRDAGDATGVVVRQLVDSVPEAARPDDTVIAYEPVWAIGTGRTPTLDQIAEIHGHIRAWLEGHREQGAAFRILYGGSVKPDNAVAILELADVDGALVGGASLKAEDFCGIIAACPAN